MSDPQVGAEFAQTPINDKNDYVLEEFAYEAKFADGKTTIVHERTYSRACVRAQWQRLQDGAETHKELHIVSGKRRVDLDSIFPCSDCVQITAELTAEQSIRLLQEVAGRHCSHIQKPYTLKEICEHVDGSEYNAELMLQHLLLWCSDYMKLP